MRFSRWLAATIAVVPLLYACGGGGGSGDGSVRLVNASESYGALNLYNSTTLLTTSGSVAADSGSSYIGLGAGTYTFALADSSGTTVSSSSRTVTSGGTHTLLAFSTSQALKTVFMTESEDDPTSGYAKLRVFNASDEAGTLDVYVTASSASLSTANANVSSLVSERFSSFSQYAAGTYRIRVTGNGDKSDLRLDIDDISLSDQQITTLVLTSTTGGVLVNSVFVDQKSTSGVTGVDNPSARVRLVAGAASSGTVAVTLNSTTVSTGLVSPNVGSYVLVPTGTLSGTVTFGGSALTLPSATLTAGSDNTLLVTSNGGVGTATLLSDDNTPPLVTTKSKFRLVNGLGNLGGTATMSANYAAIANDVAVNTASTPVPVTVSTTSDTPLSVTSGSSSLYSNSVTLSTNAVYTLWLLGDASAPTGVFLRER